MLQKLAAVVVSFSILAAVLLPEGRVRADGQMLVETEVGAKGAVVIEAETGRVLFAQNAQERLPMASTTKIMTALLTLEQPELDQYFVVDEKAIQTEGSSMGLVARDQVSLRTLAYGMLLASGNDAANAAAVRVAGTQEQFVQRMNERARELGLQNTHFVTPSGLDAEEHYSTAYDMALLAAAALQNEDFAAICSTYRAKVEYGDPPYTRWLKNHNRLLNELEGCVGVKTGFTKKSGRCLVSAVRRDNTTLICVTLGAPDDWNIHKMLYRMCFEWLTPVSTSAYLGQVVQPVTGGTLHEARLKPAGEKIFYLSAEEAERLVCRYEIRPFAFAPLKAGTVGGEAVFQLDGSEIGSVPLVYEDNISLNFKIQEKKGLWERLKEFFAGLFR